MPPRLDTVTVGEAMVLFMAAETGHLSHVRQYQRAAAGAELNVAVGLARLGLRSGYISALGRDSLGESLVDFMLQEGVDVTQVQYDEAHPTGLMFKSRVIDGGDPSIEYLRRGSAAGRLQLTDGVLAYAAGARHLHLTGIAPAISPLMCEAVSELADQARRLGQRLSFDPNLRRSLWPSESVMIETVERLAAKADLVLPGLAEGRLLTGLQTPQAISEHYLERGASQVVVKLGPSGAYAADASGGRFIPGAAAGRVVDTVGAGDGFAVGVISGLLDGLPLEEAASRGCSIGARVVQFAGDSEGLPTREQLSDFQHWKHV
jgi:2-dehydro-3-deoxygluconokinase